MIVYIEDTVIENFLITFCILQIVFGFLREKKSYLRLTLASLLGAAMALVYPVIELSGPLLFLLKMGIGYIICLVAYKTKRLKRQMFFFIMFMAVTAVYGGVNLMIYFCMYGSLSLQQKIPSVLCIVTILVVTYLLKQLELRLYHKKSINNFVYDIVISTNSGNIKTRGYLDSGNILTDPGSKSPIILVNFKMFERINKDFPISNLLTNSTSGLDDGHYVEVKTLTGTSKILTFRAKSIQILTKNEKIEINRPIFGLSKQKITGLDCDVILNSLMLGGKNV